MEKDLAIFSKIAYSFILWANNLTFMIQSQRYTDRNMKFYVHRLFIAVLFVISTFGNNPMSISEGMVE